MKKQKIIAVLISALFMLSVYTIFTSAASVHLSTSQRIASSGDVYAKQSYFFGENSNLSAGKVWFIPKYLFGGVYYTDPNKSFLVDKGANLNTKYTSERSDRNWQLVLNPDGANRYGCIADGTIIKNK